MQEKIETQQIIVSSETLYKFKIKTVTQVNQSIKLKDNILKNLGLTKEEINQFKHNCEGVNIIRVECLKKALQDIRNRIQYLYENIAINYGDLHIFADDSTAEVIEEINQLKKIVQYKNKKLLYEYEQNKQLFLKKVSEISNQAIQENLLQEINFQYFTKEECGEAIKIFVEIWELDLFNFNKNSVKSNEELWKMQSEYLITLNQEIQEGIKISEDKAYQDIAEIWKVINSVILGTLAQNQIKNEKKKLARIIKSLAKIEKYSPHLRPLFSDVKELSQWLLQTELDSAFVTKKIDGIREKIKVRVEQNKATGDGYNALKLELKLNDYYRVFQQKIQKIQSFDSLNNLEEIKQITIEVMNLNTLNIIQKRQINKIFQSLLEDAIRKAIIPDFVGNF